VGFLPAHQVIVGDGAPAPARTVFVLHGVFASGRNWQVFARRAVAARPDLRVVLVHLRGHGGSRDAPGPHSLRACSQDLSSLASELGVVPHSVWGHSFGGKVALAWMRDARPAGLSSVWSLDSPPGSGPAGGGDPLSSEVGRVLTALGAISLPIPRRAMAQEALVAQGVRGDVAGWMATNLISDGEGAFRWHFDTATVAELLRDYWNADLWPDCADPPPGVHVHLVRAGASDRWNAADRRRLDALAQAPRSTVHVVEGAGHWLHVDRPQELLGLLLSGL